MAIERAASMAALEEENEEAQALARSIGM